MPRALVIVDHGSRRDAANEMLDRVAGMVRARTGDRIYAAHMELVEPSIGQAFDRAVADGAEFVFVFPYFLSPGRHSREDIPRMCAEAAAKHPGVNWHCSGPIGLDVIMADLILHRVGECEQAGYTCEHCPQHSGCHPPRLEQGQ